MSIREFVEADIPQVADLYWTVMRNRKGSAPPQVCSFFRDVYFTDNPCVDSKIRSLVYEGKDGSVGGFLGGIVRKMSVRGQSIRVAFGGNFMVRPEARGGSLPGLRLLGALMAGDQDFSLTDSANDISRVLLERLGWSTVVPMSIHWARPLRPAEYAVYNLRRGRSPAVSSALQFAAKPFCTVADNLAATLSFSPFRQTKPRLHASELDVATLLHCMLEFRKGYSIWGDYDLSSLQWILNFMERTPSRGDLRKVVVRDDSEKIVGWFIYYAKPGAVGEVVQIGGIRRFIKDILDHLFQDAWDRGVILLHGVANRELMPDLSDKNCFFTCRGGWAVAHSRKPELVELLKRGDVFFSRLDSEWCMDPGGRLTS